MDRRFEIQRAAIAAASRQRLVQMLERRAVFAAPRVDHGQLIIRRRGVRAVPRGAIERVVRLVPAPQILKRHAPEIQAFRVGGVLIAAEQPLERPVAEGHAVLEQAVPERQPRHGRVAANVTRVPAQRLAVIVARIVIVLLVLLQMQPVDEQLLDVVVFRGALHGRARRDGLLLSALIRRVGHQPLARLALQFGGQLLEIVPVKRHKAAPALIRREIGFFRKEHGFAVSQLDHGVFERAGDVEAQIGAFPALFEIDARVDRGVFDQTDVAHGIPHLLELARLIGHEPGKVGLIVGIRAGHQLDIRPVAVGEVRAPHRAEIAVSPRPELLARSDVMIGHGHDALFPPLVVAGKEIHIGLPLRHHEGRGHAHGIIARKIGARAVVERTGGLVDAFGDRPADHGAAVVIVRPFHVGREHRAVIVVDRHGQIGPPHEQLRLTGAVVQAHLRPDVAAPRLQRHAHHALLPVERLDLAHPDGLAAVVVFLRRGLDGQEGRRAVVLRPVELDATRNPRAGQSDQRGLDHMVVIDEVIIPDLVIAGENLAADLRQDLRFDIFVLERIDLVGHIPFLVRNAVGIGQRIEPPRRALIGLFFKEHRQLDRGLGNIGRNDLPRPRQRHFFAHGLILPFIFCVILIVDDAPRAGKLKISA